VPVEQSLEIDERLPQRASKICSTARFTAATELTCTVFVTS